jgi:glycosyltransferase involved in cell wall biosynthesis
MDYTIREIASLPNPRPYLILLGAMEEDSPEIIDEGYRLLSSSGFCARSVEKEEVYDYYRAADIFALASLDEGFGLVYVEAMAHGLPCIVHDYETSQHVVGGLGIYGDLTRKGEMANLIGAIEEHELSEAQAKRRHSSVYERLSWDRLSAEYVEMFERCAGR